MSLYPDHANRPADELRRALQPFATANVLQEVADERKRQDAKWGEQNHPNLSPTAQGTSVYGPAHRAASIMCLPLADAARDRVEHLARVGMLGYADIAVEELAEAIEQAALGDDAKLRAELVQTAAVLVAWMECIDRRRAKAKGT